MEPAIPRRGFLAVAGLAAAGCGLPAGSRETPMDDPKRVLDELLARNRRRDAERGVPGKATNHVPMTLIALQRLGANAAHLHRYFEVAGSPDGGPRTAPDLAGRMDPDSWRRDLGRSDRFHRYLDYFEDRARRDSPSELLRETLPVLAAGSIGHAFHPLLRLGFALDVDDAEEIVMSLAYWAAAWAPGPGHDAGAAPAEPGELLRALERATAGLVVDRGNIQDRVEAVYGTPGFAAGLRPVAFDRARPTADMATVVAGAFESTHHFTVLHALTSCQALRRVLVHAADPAPVISAYWHAACGAWISVARRPGGRTGGDRVEPAAGGWDEVRRSMLALDPGRNASAYEHVVKLVYACWEEQAAFGGKLYLDLAAREVATPARFG